MGVLRMSGITDGRKQRHIWEEGSASPLDQAMPIKPFSEQHTEISSNELTDLRPIVREPRPPCALDKPVLECDDEGAPRSRSWIRTQGSLLPAHEPCGGNQESIYFELSEESGWRRDQVL